MKIKIENLGIIKKAELELGKLTIICGENNTGKTYVTYALYGFLTLWRRLVSINIPKQIINTLLETGTVEIDIKEYTENAQAILSKACSKYKKQLPTIFASQEKKLDESSFDMTFEQSEIEIKEEYDVNISSAKAKIFKIFKGSGETFLTVTLLTETDKLEIPEKFIINAISDSIGVIILRKLLPNPFIASAERTGAAIFQKELDFIKNRMIEKIHSEKGTNIANAILSSMKDYDYALPVKDNVDFTRQMGDISKKESFLQKNHPELLEFFDKIIGGEYKLNKNNELLFIPKKSKSTKLTMGESSSSIRSLLIIGFYLRHTARLGDILIIDEPELNLHPKNQRLMARLFAKLANIGINVFITTHSDYIIKELNTLIMLNQDLPHIEKIMEEEGYQKDELIDIKDIRVYQAKEGLIRLSGALRQTRGNTLVSADIDQQTGIGIESFDDSINKMNEIQSAILYGG